MLRCNEVEHSGIAGHVCGLDRGETQGTESPDTGDSEAPVHLSWSELDLCGHGLGVTLAAFGDVLLYL